VFDQKVASVVVIRLDHKHNLGKFSQKIVKIENFFGKIALKYVTTAHFGHNRRHAFNPEH
jgi:hypothetical protein